MTQIALFHSVLGVRPGVIDAAERLRAAGHEVEVVDQYGGRVFDDYDEASAHAETIGYPVLMDRAVAAVEHLRDGFVAAGFSNGGGMAEYVATQRPDRRRALRQRRARHRAHRGKSPAPSSRQAPAIRAPA